MTDTSFEGWATDTRTRIEAARARLDQAAQALAVAVERHGANLAASYPVQNVRPAIGRTELELAEGEAAAAEAEASIGGPDGHPA